MVRCRLGSDGTSSICRTGSTGLPLGHTGDGARAGVDAVYATAIANRRASFLTTAWQLGVILTANYTFLNYLVLSLGFLLLDDKFWPLARR